MADVIKLPKRCEKTALLNEDGLLTCDCPGRVWERQYGLLWEDSSMDLKNVWYPSQSWVRFYQDKDPYSVICTPEYNVSSPVEVTPSIQGLDLRKFYLTNHEVPPELIVGYTPYYINYIVIYINLGDEWGGDKIKGSGTKEDPYTCIPKDIYRVQEAGLYVDSHVPILIVGFLLKITGTITDDNKDIFDDRHFVPRYEKYGEWEPVTTVYNVWYDLSDCKLNVKSIEINDGSQRESVGIYKAKSVEIRSKASERVTLGYCDDCVISGIDSIYESKGFTLESPAAIISCNNFKVDLKIRNSNFMHIYDCTNGEIIIDNTEYSDWWDDFDDRLYMYKSSNITIETMYTQVYLAIYGQTKDQFPSNIGGPAEIIPAPSKNIVFKCTSMSKYDINVYSEDCDVTIRNTDYCTYAASLNKSKLTANDPNTWPKNVKCFNASEITCIGNEYKLDYIDDWLMVLRENSIANITLVKYLDSINDIISFKNNKKSASCWEDASYGYSTFSLFAEYKKSCYLLTYEQPVYHDSTLNLNIKAQLAKPKEYCSNHVAGYVLSTEYYENIIQEVVDDKGKQKHKQEGLKLIKEEPDLNYAGNTININYLEMIPNPETNEGDLQSYIPHIFVIDNQNKINIKENIGCIIHVGSTIEEMHSVAEDFMRNTCKSCVVEEEEMD